MHKCKYGTNREGSFVSNGRTTILLPYESFSTALIHAKDMARHMHNGLIGLDVDLTGYQYVRQVRLMCDMAEDLITPEAGIDLFGSLPLDRKGRLSDSLPILLYQMPGPPCVAYVSAKLQEGTSFKAIIGHTNGLWISQHANRQDTWIMSFRWQPPRKAIFRTNPVTDI